MRSQDLRRFRLLMLAVVPLALLAAACGGDDEPAAATSSSTTSTSTTAAAEDADDATDEQTGNAWQRNASEHRQQVGDQIDVDCPAGGTLAVIWGSNVYTDDSSICSAAVHVGLITVEDGGEVRIEIVEGQDEYIGSESNGVESLDFGPYAGSFSFPDAEQLEVETAIAWDRPANFYSGRDTTEFTVTCAADGQPGAIWGTKVYTEDSSICTAAVHSGLITLEDGGEVTFELVEGQDAYEGSTANGVTSSEFGTYGGSFRFVED